MATHNMKNPVSYYGGKYMMLQHILPMIPEHRIYVEPFVGGGSVFWAKKPSPVEVINDRDLRVYNFYQMISRRYDELAIEVDATCHSRTMHEDAKWILENKPELTSEVYQFYTEDVHKLVKKSWAFWMQCNMSYSSKINGGFAYSRSDRETKKIRNRKRQFTNELRERLDNVCIENNDALKVITSRDTADTFVYCDPPYVNTNCGHYEGYTESDYQQLLDTLGQLKGKFLLSSFPTDQLDAAIERYGWKTQSFEKAKTAGGYKHISKKTEVLTYNYDL